MRSLAAMIVILLPVAALNASVSPRPAAHPYRQHWRQTTFGKRQLAGVGARAGVGQLTGHPHNYGGGLAGFGKRLGAGFGTHAVKTTVEHGIAAPLHEDLHYHRSNKTGLGPRLGYALKSTVITSNTKTGKRVPAVGRVSGHAAAGAVSQAAFHAGSGAATAGIGLAADAGANVAREFWPRREVRRARK